MPHRRTVLTGLLSALGTGGAMAAPRSKPPMNLLFIMADDLGEWAVGAYGNLDVATPNIDRLSRMGATFRQAFVPTGVCTPSRAAALTGRFPPEVGMTDIVSGVEGLNNGLPPGVQTWSRATRDGGWRTAAIGKWHLGDDAVHAPRHYGFDYFFGYLHGDREPWNPTLIRDDATHAFEPAQHKGYVTDILTDDALAYLKQKDERPFAMLLAYDAPHWPYGPTPKEDSAPFEGKDLTIPKSEEMDHDYEEESRWRPWPEARAMNDDYVKRRRASYYSAVHSLDRNVGRVLDYLEASGKIANTLIILMSDNGYIVGQRGMQSKGDGMPIRLTMQSLDSIMTYKNLYDISLRVPLVVYDPSSRARGVEVRRLVSSVDLYPTILAALKLDPPQGAVVRGQSLLPLVRNETTQWRDAVFGIYDSTFLRNVEFLRSIRTDRWKLIIRAFNPEGAELYDIVKDPDEKENLYYRRTAAAEDKPYLSRSDLANAVVIDDLEARLLAWRTSIDDVTLELESKYYRRTEAAAHAH